VFLLAYCPYQPPWNQNMAALRRTASMIRYGCWKDCLPTL
jgi:hypothetical protein